MKRRIIKRETPVELIAEIYRREGWKRSEGESQTKRIQTLYEITVDHKIGKYVATPNEEVK